MHRPRQIGVDRRVDKESRMHLRYFGSFGAMLICAYLLLALPVSVGAAAAAQDALRAMRVRPIAPPVPAGNLVLRGIDGRRIRLSDFRGKAVLLEFFLTN